MGNVFFARDRSWNDVVLDTLEAFPYGPHDDDADAISGAFAVLPREERDVEATDDLAFSTETLGRNDFFT